MVPQLERLSSRAARNIVASITERGWNVEVRHTDGILIRNGRSIQDVPSCRLRARRGKAMLSVKVQDWHQDRAEFEAAKELEKFIPLKRGNAKA